MKRNVELSEISDGRLYTANDMVKADQLTHFNFIRIMGPKQLQPENSCSSTLVIQRQIYGMKVKQSSFTHFCPDADGISAMIILVQTQECPVFNPSLK